MLPFVDQADTSAAAQHLGGTLTLDELLNKSGTPSNARTHHLVVDLDGTLVKTDMLAETALRFLLTRPFSTWRIPLWLIKGRSHLKAGLAQATEIDYHRLPYHRDLLEHLQLQKANGRKLTLATASHGRIAQGVADHLNIFDQVIASDADNNMKGERKLQLILKTLGPSFDYVGDAKADLPIWRKSQHAITVGCSNALRQRIQQSTPIDRHFTRESRLRATLRCLRPHQWVKNLLIFVPLITAHLVTEPQALIAVLLAFIAFSAISSAGYLINDLWDIDSDRQHTTKKQRPVANGDLPIAMAMGLIPLMMAIGIAVSTRLSPAFMICLAVYFIGTFTYSIFLKRLILVDVITLACLFTLRIFAGANAIDVVVSQWLIAYSMFTFLSLAMLKRYAELHNLRNTGKTKASGRGYQLADIDLLWALGIGSACISIMVLSLYITHRDIVLLYTRPVFLWLICPAIFYWISRVWLMARRGLMNEDPILFAVRDKASYLVGLLVALSMSLAL